MLLLDILYILWVFVMTACVAWLLFQRIKQRTRDDTIDNLFLSISGALLKTGEALSTVKSRVDSIELVQAIGPSAKETPCGGSKAEAPHRRCK